MLKEQFLNEVEHLRDRNKFYKLLESLAKAYPKSFWVNYEELIKSFDKQHPKCEPDTLGFCKCAVDGYFYLILKNEIEDQTTPYYARKCNLTKYIYRPTRGISIDCTPHGRSKYIAWYRAVHQGENTSHILVYKPKRGNVDLLFHIIPRFMVMKGDRVSVLACHVGDSRKQFQICSLNVDRIVSIVEATPEQ